MPIKAQAQGNIELLVIYQDKYNPVQWRIVAEGFAQYKTNTGIPAKALGLEEIKNTYNGRDTAEKIKQAIYDEYLSNSNLKYVLLVGDCNIFPVRFYFMGWKQSGVARYGENCTLEKQYVFLPSDYYFADIDLSSGETTLGNSTWDFFWNANTSNLNSNLLIGEIYWDNLNPDGIGIYPEVAVGRVPSKTLDEFLAYIVKVMKYEREIRTSGGYHKVLFISDLYPNDEETNRDIGENVLGQGWDLTYLIEKAKNNETVKWFEIREGPGYSWVGELNYIDYNDTLPIIENYIPEFININSPQFINYNGHGWPGGWGGFFTSQNRNKDKYKYSNQVLDLTNEVPAIVFSAACDTAKFVNTDQKYFTKSDALNDLNAGLVKNGETQDLLNNVDSIAESLINNANGGAVVYIGDAVVAQSWAQDLNKYFFQAIANGTETVGDAWKNALKKYADEKVKNLRVERDGQTCNGQQDYNWRKRAWFEALLKYHLFGDPSLRVEGVTGVNDNTAPRITVDGWPGRYTSSNFSVRISANDDDSGIMAVGYRYRVGSNHWTHWQWGLPWEAGSNRPVGTVAHFPQGEDGEGLMLEVRAIDLAGNVSTRLYGTIFDSTSPDCRAEVKGDVVGHMISPIYPPPLPYWEPPKIYACPVIVELKTYDEISPVSISYKIDEEEDWLTIPRQSVSVRIPCDLHKPGIHDFVITYYATDAAGNRSEEKTVRLYVDTTLNLEELLWRTEEIGKLTAAKALREGVWVLQLAEEAFGGIPSRVKFDFRGPITAENRNPAWQHIGEAERIIIDGKAYWQSPKWNTSRLPTGWYEIRAVPGFSPFAEEKGVSFFIFVNNISPEKYHFDVEIKDREVRPGSKLRIKVSFSQEIGELTEPRLGLFLGPSLILEGKKEFRRKTLKPGEKWSEVFEFTLASELSPQDVELKAYLFAREVGLLKSRPIKFSIFPSNIKVSGRVTDTYGIPVRARVSLGDWETMTNKEGYYIFEDVPPGKYLLKVTPMDKRLRQVLPKEGVEIVSKGKDITQDFLFAVADKVAPWVSAGITWEDFVKSGCLFGFVADNPWGEGIREVKIAVIDQIQEKWWNPEAGQWVDAEYWFNVSDLKPVRELYSDISKSFPDLPQALLDGLKRLTAKSTNYRPILVWYYCFKDTAFLSKGSKIVKIKAVDAAGNIGYNELYNYEAYMIRASFEVIPIKGKLYTYRFVNRSVGWGAPYYYWDFGDGTTSQEVNPVHTYKSPGVYQVKLIVSTESQSDSATLKLSVTPFGSFMPRTIHGLHH